MKTYEEVATIMQEVANNVNFIKLSDDHSCYVNTITGKEYQRVTQYISDEIVEMTPLLLSSVTIGTKVDELVRDFFDGTLKEEYNVSSATEVENFISQLKQLKKLFDKRGEVIIPNDVVLYNDEIGVAGTVDLISYDKYGNVRIYDMKTQRGNQFTTMWYGDCEYKYFSTMYGMSNYEKHQRQISMYNILLNNTHGIRAIAGGIIPIEVKYQAGDVTTEVLRMLKPYRHTLLEHIKDAKLIPV